MRCAKRLSLRKAGCKRSVPLCSHLKKAKRVAYQVVRNTCIFSSDRRYRYLLRHTWEPLFAPKYCVWIGLNPSVADETQLDPTLRRIRSFSVASGYNGFIMTNLFGLVSTDPDRLYTVNDPVGPENDHCILQAATETGKVVAAWGILGGHQKRCQTVLKMLSCFDVMCLKETKAGYPIHPLYVAGDTGLVSYRKAQTGSASNSSTSR